VVSSFGSVPHAELLKSAARRIVDRRVLHLIKMWLDCPVEETDDRGRKTRTTEARDKRRGIPQGSPISPLLANIYMRRFVLGWKMFGLERTLGTRLVTYADAHESPHFHRTRKSLNLGFPGRLDGESAGGGVHARTEGAI
jgi:retron-type reverse transcriptase